MIPDGASVPRDVSDESPAQDPKVGTSGPGQAVKVVERVQRFPQALSRQRSQSEIENRRIAQGERNINNQHEIGLNFKIDVEG